MKKINVPCSFQLLEDFNDSKFLRAKIKVQHDKDNLNGSYFELEDIKRCAEKSLRLSPILGSVVYDEELGKKRLNGHDMECRIIHTEDDVDIEIVHIERIYGVIPQDAEFTYEYDEKTQKTYLVTECVLWKDYLDEVEDILKETNQTDVSMEIKVNEYSFRDTDEYVHILDFDYTGISMIGVPPAMQGACLELFSNEVSDRIFNLKNQMEEIINQYTLEKEEKGLEENNKFEEVIEPEVIEDDFKKDDDEEKEKCQAEEYAILLENYNNLQKEYEELKEKYAQLESQMADYNELKEFKNNFEKEKHITEINEVCEMFELSEEEMSTFKEKALNYEITIDGLKKELGFLFAMKVKDVKKEESKEVSVFTKGKEYKPYGDLFDN